MDKKDAKALLKELGGIRTALEKLVAILGQSRELIPDDGVLFDEDKKDELYGDARKIVLQAGQASTSYLQRKLGIGYARAAKLIDMLEEKGVIGPAIGSRPRPVIHRITPEVIATLEKIEKNLKEQKRKLGDSTA